VIRLFVFSSIFGLALTFAAFFFFWRFFFFWLRLLA
jgi:hypothetical protein